MCVGKTRNAVGVEEVTLTDESSEIGLGRKS